MPPDTIHCCHCGRPILLLRCLTIKEEGELHILCPFCIKKQPLRFEIKNEELEKWNAGGQGCLK